MSLVLDTHIFVWWYEDPSRLSRAQRQALKRLGPEQPAYISDVSFWEIAMLVSAGRLRPKIPLREWFELALERPYLEVCPITPAIACEMATLGSAMHKDPADRMIVCTARVLNATCLTADQAIIKSGIIPVIG